MYAGRDFDPVDNNSGQIFGFDFAATLPTGTHLVTAQSGLILENGDDDIPSAHTVGVPEIVGNMVTQALFWGQPARTFAGNTYVFFIAARTDAGEVIVAWARVGVEKSYGQSTFRSTASPLNASVFVIPLPGPLFIPPSLGGYALQDLPPLDQGEQRFCGFNFASLLSAGEALSNLDVSLTVIAGTDPAIDKNPIAYFPIPTTISGPFAQQLIAIPPLASLLGRPPQLPDLRGVVYAFAITAQTSFGQVINSWSRLPIRSFFA